MPIEIIPTIHIDNCRGSRAGASPALAAVSSAVLPLCPSVIADSRHQRQNLMLPARVTVAPTTTWNSGSPVAVPLAQTVGTVNLRRINTRSHPAPWVILFRDCVTTRVVHPTAPICSNVWVTLAARGPWARRPDLAHLRIRRNLFDLKAALQIRATCPLLLRRGYSSRLGVERRAGQTHSAAPRVNPSDAVGSRVSAIWQSGR